MIHLATRVITKRDRELHAHILYELSKEMYRTQHRRDLTPFKRTVGKVRYAELDDRLNMLRDRITKLICQMYHIAEDGMWECDLLSHPTSLPSCDREWVFQYDITADKLDVVNHTLRKLDFIAMHKYGIDQLVSGALDNFNYTFK